MTHRFRALFAALCVCLVHRAQTLPGNYYILNDYSKFHATVAVQSAVQNITNTSMQAFFSPLRDRCLQLSLQKCNLTTQLRLFVWLCAQVLFVNNYHTAAAGSLTFSKIIKIKTIIEVLCHRYRGVKSLHEQEPATSRIKTQGSV